MISKATATTIRIAVPPIVKKEMPVIILKMLGRIAISPRKIAPQRVILLIIFPKKMVVDSPGLMPVIKPPER